MVDKVEFELVSPEKLLVSQPVFMVVVPSADGMLGVLPDHAPMIVTIKPGVIDVYDNDMTTISRRIFVAGGFCEVTGRRVTVLAEEAGDVDTLRGLDRAALESALQAARAEADAAQSETERKAAEQKAAVAQAKLDLQGTVLH
ncbi:ATP synthase F1 subunit epsilon [Oleisolibacter albus]|uniref:ATP synthase F1 subunit epsilon n=1 Tax=Oleisolibacter albus TaxID=2171757 RepID=UPI000DF224BC|nr:ATP synthase F1 subunit epsilon [Oleisolibacter albus]